jgi:hypothetical protein
MADTQQCSHTIIEDTIDIDPDTSKQVFYCETCFATFEIKVLPDNTVQYIEICSHRENDK